MPYYSYSCCEGHTTERLAPWDKELITCPECGQTAQRAQVNRIGVAGFAKGPASDLSQEYRRASEFSSELDYKASQIEKSTGQPVQTPNFVRMGMEKAKQRLQAP